MEVAVKTSGSQQIDFKVDLAGRSDLVFAGHYYPARPPERGLLQVLVHGNTYDHRYWDAGRIDGHDYSYAQYMTERGYAILAMDLPGTGSSSKPDGDSVDLDSVGRALTSVISIARQPGGPLDAVAGRVALVGHSLGAVVSIYTQASWQAADFLIATGVGALAPPGPTPFGAAVFDDALSREYVSLPASARRRVFYHLPTADPEVISFDNTYLRTTMPRQLYKDAFAARADLTKSRAPDVLCPVYVQLGEHDPIAPGSSASRERECWARSAEVTVEELNDIGHCFNLHINREEGWEAIDQYLARH
jgi:pimeloyl-ACP methyl ester carboxylesterase